MRLSKSMKCLQVTSLNELSDYRDGWEELRRESGGSVFTSYLLTSLRLEHYHETVSPNILLVEDHGDISGIAPFALSRDEIMGFPIETLTFVGRDNGRPSYSSLGPLVDLSVDGVIDCLAKGMRSLDWNVLRARDMESDLGSRHFIERMEREFKGKEYVSSIGALCTFSEKEDVSEGFDRKFRREILSTIRRLELENRLKIRSTSSSDEAERAMRVYIRQHIDRWQSRGGSRFQILANAEFIVKMAVAAQENGIGTVHEVLIDDQVAGQTFVLFDGKVARAYLTGMDDSFAKYRPGRLTMYFAMADAHQRGYTVWDFGRGDDDYKMHFGAKPRPLVGVRAERGPLSGLSKLYHLPPIQRLDEKLRIRQRLFETL